MYIRIYSARIPKCDQKLSKRVCYVKARFRCDLVEVLNSVECCQFSSGETHHLGNFVSSGWHNFGAHELYILECTIGVHVHSKTHFGVHVAHFGVPLVQI